MRTVLQVEDILDKEGEVMIYNTCEIYNTAAHANTPSTKISTTDIASSSTLKRLKHIPYHIQQLLECHKIGRINEDMKLILYSPE